MSLLDDWDNSASGVPAAVEYSNPANDFMGSGYTDVAPVTMSSVTPMFQLELQHKPQELVDLSVANNFVVVGLKSGNVQRLDLDQAAEIETLQVVKTKSVADTIDRVFVSPTGAHSLVSIATGEAHYLHRSWTKPVRVKGLRNMHITAVAWNKRERDSETGEFLVGTRRGELFSVRLAPVKAGKVDETVASVYSVGKEVTGIELEYMDGVSAGGGPKYCVLATNATQMFQFIGGPDMATLFERYATSPQFFELPGDLGYSRLATYCAPGASRPNTFAWLTSHGIYYGTLNFANQGPGETVTTSPGLVGYQGVLAEGMFPLALVLTEFHILLVYATCYQAISRLDERVVVEEPFAASVGRVVGVTTDTTSGSMWLYGSGAVFEIYVNDESRDVWKLYLEKREYNRALEYTFDPVKRDIILTAQAEEHFAAGEYEAAAAAYARTLGSPFEEIALRFINLGQVSALKEFLIRKLDVLPDSDATQRTLICTWLTEIFLTQLNALEGKPDAAITAGSLKAEFEAFLELNKDALNVATTFHLISSHGRVDEMLVYARLIGDLERIITHHIHAAAYSTALETIVRHARLNAHLDSARDLFYKFSPVLMHYLPAATVDAWMLVGDMLAPSELIPALTRYDRSAHPHGPHQAVRYLYHVVFELGVADPTIHNFLVSLLAESGDEDDLLAFLHTPDPKFDLKYALRLCTKLNKTRSCVAIYSAMEMYDEAVDLALTVDLDLAIETTRSMEQLHADDTTDEEHKPSHKLWLKIAKHVLQPAQDLASFDAQLAAAGRTVESLDAGRRAAHAQLAAAAKAGVDKAISFLSDNNVLRIEDVLPFFPDFTVIDEFKSKICEALTSYDEAITLLEYDMGAATASAELIRQDIKGIKNRYGFVQARQKCDYCSYPILTRDFYLFSCQHVFHFDCLFGAVTPTFSSARRAHVDDLMDEVLRTKDAVAAAPANAASSGVAAQDSSAAEVACAAAQDALDAVIAAECLYCGRLMIDQIDKPFVEQWEERERMAWRL